MITCKRCGFQYADDLPACPSCRTPSAEMPGWLFRESKPEDSDGLTDESEITPTDGSDKERQSSVWAEAFPVEDDDKAQPSTSNPWLSMADTGESADISMPVAPMPVPSTSTPSSVWATEPPPVDVQPAEALPSVSTEPVPEPVPEPEPEPSVPDIPPLPTESVADTVQPAIEVPTVGATESEAVDQPTDVAPVALPAEPAPVTIDSGESSYTPPVDTPPVDAVPSSPPFPDPMNAPASGTSSEQSSLSWMVSPSSPTPEATPVPPVAEAPVVPSPEAVPEPPIMELPVVSPPETTPVPPIVETPVELPPPIVEPPVVPASSIVEPPVVPPPAPVSGSVFTDAPPDIFADRPLRYGDFVADPIPDPLMPDDLFTTPRVDPMAQTPPPPPMPAPMPWTPPVQASSLPQPLSPPMPPARSWDDFSSTLPTTSASSYGSEPNPFVADSASTSGTGVPIGERQWAPLPEASLPSTMFIPPVTPSAFDEKTLMRPEPSDDIIEQTHDPRTARKIVRRERMSLALVIVIGTILIAVCIVAVVFIFWGG